MRRNLYVLAAICAAVLLSGCVGNQSRDSREDISQDRIIRERQLHGPAGQTIARIFTSDEFEDIFRDTSGRDRGMQLVDFYYIQMAEDPLNPHVLSIVGYIRQLEHDGDGTMFYEFYDDNWLRVALLDRRGNLFHIASGEEIHMGRHQLDGAAHALFNPQTGYGYDRLQQDRAGVRMWDPQVSSMDPASRGAFHRRHRDAPAVLVLSRARAGEAAQLAERFRPDRFEEGENIRLQRIREDRHGGIGQDGRYGGLHYRDGNPVDDNDRPMRRGSITYD